MTEVATRFKAPSEEVIIDYLQIDKGMDESNAKAWAFHFWSFYESKNWMIGKNKMANWRIALGRALTQWQPPKQLKASNTRYSYKEVVAIHSDPKDVRKMDDFEVVKNGDVNYWIERNTKQ